VAIQGFQAGQESDDIRRQSSLDLVLCQAATVRVLADGQSFLFQPANGRAIWRPERRRRDEDRPRQPCCQARASFASGTNAIWNQCARMWLMTRWASSTGPYSPFSVGT